MKPWKTTSRKVILDHSKFLTVESHTVELPDGRIIEDWPWVITPDFINVIALTPENKALCFRQTKYAVEGITLAPVGGHIDPGEDPLEAAQRELLEETGYQAKEWINLGSFKTMANRGGATGHAYLALDAVLVGSPNSDDLEEQELLQLDLEQLENALIKGEFKIFSWSTSVALAILRIKATPHSF